MREATKQHILREAAREFARLGFDQANINVIAEQAGIGSRPFLILPLFFSRIAN
jgi:AcrR family transcriptional regulator